MGLLVAGTKYRGEFEERLKKLMEEIKQNDNIILVSHRLLTELCGACCRQSREGTCLRCTQGAVLLLRLSL